jgi:ArsR family transcriptional regulator
MLCLNRYPPPKEERLLDSLRAIAEETRLRILALLRLGEFSVSDLVQILGQSQPRVSRHLKLLCEAGLIIRFREQNFIFYRLGTQGLSAELSRFLLRKMNFEKEPYRLDLQRAELLLSVRRQEAEGILARLQEQMAFLATLLPKESLIQQQITAMLRDVPIGQLLDVGTGTGRMLKLLAKRATEAVGIDISPEMLRLARSRLSQAGLNHVSVRQGDMYRLSFPDESFDTATIDHVLSLAEQPDAVLGEVARLIRPGGHLFLHDFETRPSLSDQNPTPIEGGLNAGDLLSWCAREGFTLIRQTSLEGLGLAVLLFLFRKESGEV